MKRIPVLLIVIFYVTSGFSQVSLRQAASKYLSSGKLDSAMVSINLCIKNPATLKDAKAWFIRGNVYLEIAYSDNYYYKTLDNNPVEKALNSYKKAKELDYNKEFTADIFTKVNWQRNTYFNQGVDYYNKKYYKEAMTAFENGANALAYINEPDTVSLFYAAACAGLANITTKAKEFYIQLIENHTKSTSIYISLSDIYRQENDSVNALKVIRSGQKLYPGNIKLFLTETNIYLTFGNMAKALQNLKQAVRKDSTNSTIFFALGTIYDKLSIDAAKSNSERENYFDLAAKAYKKAIRINADYFEPNYNIGALYVNKAADIMDKANLLPLDADAEYNKQKAEANKWLEEAIPYLEKASEIQPSDLSTLISLQSIYKRFNRTDKLQIVKEKIDAIQKK